MRTMRELTDKQREFCRQYLRLAGVTGQGHQAYSMVYNVKHMTAGSIGSAVQELLNNPKVIEYVEERRAAAAFKFDVTQAMVLKVWWEIATADVNLLMRHRRINCRHCHGAGHAYQWRDLAEYADACAAEDLAATDEKREARFPSDDGGYGFDRVAPPHPSCPQCSGEGYGDVWVADTGNLEGAARTLYAGVKQTRHGLEIITRDQDEAMANVARYLGMFHDRAPGAANGNPIPPAATYQAKSAADMAKFYRELMG